MSSAANSEYCKKDGDFDEFGTIRVQGEQGRRSDLEIVIAWADQYAATNGRAPREVDIAREYPVAFTKFPRLMHTIRLRTARVRFNPVDFFEWQAELKTRLDEDPDDRVIDFVLDLEGGKGKTTFCRQMLMDRPDDTQILSVGKSADLAYAVDTSKSVFLFNVPRGKMEFISYQLLEQLKDQLVWSPKYLSGMKIMERPVHVVVFSNEHPDMTQLTPDRYNIINLE